MEDAEIKPTDRAPLALDRNTLRGVSARWRKMREWPADEDDIPDDWYNSQCGMCIYFVPLQGVFRKDYGACINAHSPADGRVVFEHDGCDVYAPASEWVTAYLAKHVAEGVE